MHGSVKFGLSFGAFALLCGHAPALAQDDAAVVAEPVVVEEEAADEGLQFDAFVDGYYMFNMNGKNRGGGGVRAFDTETNSFTVAQAEAATWMNSGPFGFRIDLNYTPQTVADPMTAVQQAYAGVHFDVGGGLQIDIGKFMTPIGGEVVEARDNMNYSRSFVFQFAEPVTHTGVRAWYTIDSQYSVGLYLVNGWDNVIDGNDAKTIGVSFAAAPVDGLNLYLNYMFGNESNSDAQFDDLRHIVDLVATYQPIDALKLGLNVDLGVEGAMADSPVSVAFALSARYAFVDWFAIAARGEYFSDPDGARLGGLGAPGGPGAKSLWETTVTLEGRYQENAILRLEYRHDAAGEEIFADGDGPKDSQDTITIGTIIGI